MSSRVSQLAVAFVSDRRFAKHTAVAIESLLVWNHELVGELFVFTPAGDARHFKTIACDLEQKWSTKLQIMEVDPAIFQGMFVSGHVTSTTYARFFLADLLPRHLARVLYLDSDLLVLGPLDRLSEKFIDSSCTPWSLAAVNSGNGDHLVKLGFKGGSYFNSGVMLLNLVVWRQRSVSALLAGLTRRLGSKLHTWDQDVLNLFFAEEWLALDADFNVVAGAEPPDSATILHFAGKLKPWMFGAPKWQIAVYRNYRSRTRYKRFVPSGFFFLLKRILVPKPYRNPQKTIRRVRRRVRNLFGGSRVSRENRRS